jgi:hypothetical protein
MRQFYVDGIDQTAGSSMNRDATFILLEAFKQRIEDELPANKLKSKEQLAEEKSNEFYEKLSLLNQRLQTGFTLIKNKIPK